MIKHKSLIVIILSSVLISAAILLTIIGISLYNGWSQGESARMHMARVSELNADLYGDNLQVQDLKAEYGRKGMHKGRCLIKGLIKNNGYRTVSSIEMALELTNASGAPVHIERFSPLKTSTLPRAATIAAVSLFTSGKESPLLPGESVRFVHVLSEQKKKSVVSPIKNKRYATNPNEWAGKFNYRIDRIRF